MAVLWWRFLFLPGTASWALWSLSDAVNHHQGELAASYIDFDSVTRYVFEETFKKKVAQDSSEGKDDPSTLLGEALGRGIGSMMVGPVAQTIKVRFEQKVSDANEHDVHVQTLALAGAIWRLHCDGDTASTWGTDKDGQRVDVTLSKTDSGWKISRVGGEALQKQLDDAVRAKPPSGPPTPEL